MKKIIFTAMSAVLAVAAFTGCNDNKSTPPATTFQFTALNVTGATQGISEARAFYTADVNFANPAALQPGTTAIADPASFANNSFTFTFPLTVASANLKPVTQANFLEGIALSASFNGIFAYFQGYAGTTKAGHFAFSASQVAGYLAYSDANVTIKGTATAEDGAEYDADLSVKVGWNWVYVKTETIAADQESDPVVVEHQKYTVRTTAFEGVTPVWNYVAPPAEPETPEVP